MQFGLLGKKLGHSYSPQIHQKLGSFPYDLFEKQPEELGDFLKSGTFYGLNVTIPYKKDVIPYCSQLTPIAESLGSVNTLVRKPDGNLIGHNTDYYGFQSMVKRSGLALAGKKVLVLGSGGASVTVCAVLKELQAMPVVISRSGPNNYQNLSLHKDAAAIVNTTPVGMYPNTGTSPVNLDLFPNLEGVLDLIYNPSRTKLLMDAQQRGLVTENGLWMLVAQAKESAQWFLGKTIEDFEITRIYQKLKNQSENIVLIGMPGCGKSTVGNILAQKLNRKLADVDAEIVRRAGMSIPEIFRTQGEAAFRRLESDVLADLGKCSGLVIATGGGCVTKEENYEHLHQNGCIFWIQRPLEELPTEGRPLSVQTDLQDMYRIRKPMYEQFADRTVLNTGSPEETATQILQMEEHL